MRFLLAASLLALLLAGCTAADDPTPPNADPNGPAPSFPPTPSSNTTGPASGTPTGTISTSSSSTSTASPAPATQFGSHDEEESASDADFGGLTVNGRLQGSGPRLAIEATANKFSPASYKVPDGMCVQPWTESMRGPSGLVQHRQPVATCAAFGLRAMEDHEAISTALAWNGTLWDAALGRFVAAPAGSYTWTATFHVYSGGSGASYDESASLSLDFDVRVP